jgi:hypothetical protein
LRGVIRPWNVRSVRVLDDTAGGVQRQFDPSGRDSKNPNVFGNYAVIGIQ